MTWEINKDLFDPFTLVHAAGGFFMARLGASFTTTFLIGVAWEIVEPWLKDQYPDQFPNPSRDSTPNKITDIAAWMIGWSLGVEQK